MNGPVIQTLRPVTHDLGGFQVHRVLPHRDRTTVGPFVFFDQMGPAKLPSGGGIDVRPHPHVCLATVTYLFAGAIDHRDSLGTFRTIEPGAVNLMTAGRGIVHSERTPMAARPAGPDLSGIQTWLALPSAKEELDPAFEHVRADRLPEVEGDRATVRVILGTVCGATSPATTHSPTIYADLQLLAGGAVPLDPDADERAVFLVEGDASVDGVPLDPSSLYVLAPGSRLILRSERGARVMLAGGAPLDGPRHVWWNFVASRRERIAEARDAWREGRFPLVPGDEGERIPLPEVPKTVSYP